MTKPILLGLSSFRWGEEQIAHAVAAAAESSVPLVAAFVVDINLARYFAHTGVMAGTSLREEMEKGILDEHRRQAQDVLDQVKQLAGESSVECSTLMRVGRFATEMKAIIDEVQPESVIVTRSKRPAWLRKLFGSPIDRLCEEAGDHCNIDIV